jgi:hypothetical protein
MRGFGNGQIEKNCSGVFDQTLTYRYVCIDIFNIFIADRSAAENIEFVVSLGLTSLLRSQWILQDLEKFDGVA